MAKMIFFEKKKKKKKKKKNFKMSISPERK